MPMIYLQGFFLIWSRLGPEIGCVMGLITIALKGIVYLFVPQRIVFPGIFLESNDGRDLKPQPYELHVSKLYFVGTM